MAAAVAAVALVAGCSRDDRGSEATSSPPGATTGEATGDSRMLSVAEASDRRPRSRVTVEGALFISFIQRERTRLCAAIAMSGAAPECKRPAFPARVTQGPLDGFESTPDGWFIWSPRPMRFVGSFRGKVFVIERIVG